MPATTSLSKGLTELRHKYSQDSRLSILEQCYLIVRRCVVNQRRAEAVVIQKGESNTVVASRVVCVCCEYIAMHK